MSEFTPEIYDRIRDGCQRSAARIVPRLIEDFKPRRVVDVGGGEGWWARAFVERGVDYALVLDETLSERRENVGDGILEFGPATLSSTFLKDIDVGGFDVAVCLEVAEHLSVAAGDELVRALSNLAPIVVFSAAIPHQGGHGHVNEQWPRYWADRFAIFGMACHDELRWEFWDDRRVEPWYRQNLLVFAKQPGASLRVGLDGPAAVVHPEIYGWRVAERAVKETK